MFNNMVQIKKANEAISHCWFSEATMNFFNTNIESGVFYGKYFITSERHPGKSRHFNIRMANEDGSIDTIGDFNKFSTLAAARNELERIVNEPVE